MSARSEPSGPVALVLSKLPGHRRSGSEWKATCPAHPDPKPSLKIQQGDDGRALLFCHARCETIDILAQLGLTWSDLFVSSPENIWSQPRTVVATYNYQDASGVVLYRVVRSEPKTFRFEAADDAEADGWRTGQSCMDGVRRVLYRLPAVLHAVRAGEPVYVTEGEKDADRMVGFGVCATTSPGGAGKWGKVPDAASVLSGAQVVVVADTDKAGWLHTVDIVESIGAVADTVAVVASKVGNDFCDHAAAGFGVGDLVEVDPRSELVAILGDPDAPRDTFSMVPRRFIYITEGFRLDDACVRLFAVVDEAPGREIRGRNYIAERLGWAPGKVATHSRHLVAAGLLKILDRPSGDGHKATTYRVRFNPAREGAVGKWRTTAPPADGDGPDNEKEPPISSTDLLQVGNWRTTQEEAVGNRQTTPILSTSAVSDRAEDEAETVALLMAAFPGTVIVSGAR